MTLIKATEPSPSAGLFSFPIAINFGHIRTRNLTRVAFLMLAF